MPKKLSEVLTTPEEIDKGIEALGQDIMECINKWFMSKDIDCPNAYIINEAMAGIWYSYCGQLSPNKQMALMHSFNAKAICDEQK